MREVDSGRGCPGAQNSTRGPCRQEDGSAAQLRNSGVPQWQREGDTKQRQAGSGQEGLEL